MRGKVLGKKKKFPPRLYILAKKNTKAKNSPGKVGGAGGLGTPFRKRNEKSPPPKKRQKSFENKQKINSEKTNKSKPEILGKFF